MAWCTACGRRGDERFLQRAGAQPDLRVCDVCAAKYGVGAVASDADRQFGAYGTQALPWKLPRCGHCGQIMLVDTRGRYPMWCNECERHRRRIQASGGG